MTEAEWRYSTDVVAMIGALWQLYADDRQELERLLHRYYLACCRAIWKLIPDEASRNAVALAEREVNGLRVTSDELEWASYTSEGAAFGIDYCDSDELPRWLADAEAIPEAELRAMIHPPEALSDLSMHELIKRAAYFAFWAFQYGSCPMKELQQYPPLPYYVLFCSPEILRDIFGNPFARRKKSGV